MSVRMALAKLCACACGGAIVGGGAVHVADSARARGAYTHKVTKRIVRRATTVAAGGARVGRVGARVRKVVTQTTTTTQPQIVYMTAQGDPVPVAPPYSGSGGGGGGTTVIGGSGGFGGGGFFAGGFFGGGGSSGGGSIVAR